MGNDMRVGKILIDSGILSKNELSDCLEFQEAIRTTRGKSMMLLELVMPDPRERIDFLEKNNISLNLGEKLIKAGLITKEKLSEALVLRSISIKW